MIDIVPVVPTEENAIAVAIAAGSMPMTMDKLRVYKRTVHGTDRDPCPKYLVRRDGG
jgi:hypothetical protein